MRKLLVILGPTATGKTDLALNLAKKFNGELIACDSRQVYKGLDIGTGKMPSKSETSSEILRYAQNDIRGKGYWIINGIKIWMYDVVDPKVQYSVANYVKDATKVVEDILERGKLPIIVGGTGLYIKALLEGIPNLAIPVDKKLRGELEKLSLLELQEKLKAFSPTRYKKLNDSDRQNSRRLVRAIELSLSSRLPRHFVPRNDVLRIGLTAPREVLYKNVDLRILSRINQGMIEEAQKLHKNGLTLKRMRQLGLEYGVLSDYLDGKIKSQDKLVKIMQGKIHGYVRRQQTWFKKEKKVSWFDITERNWSQAVEKQVQNWYNS